MTRHDCAPPTGGDKKITWRCPTCRRKWHYQPDRSSPGLLGALLGHRNRDGSKPDVWGGR